MPGEEHKIMNRAENRARSAIISSTKCTSNKNFMSGMQEWVIQIPSILILVSVLFPSLHLKYFRIKFLLLVCIVFMRMRTKPHPHPV